MLHINDISHQIGARTLLDQATVALRDGMRAGLVGRNGSGKTTLLKFILGEADPTSGEVSIKPGARLGHVAQEVAGDERKLIEIVLEADRERTALLKEAETATDPARIGEIHNRLGDIDAHSAPARAASILKGLGFSDDAQQKPAKEFSGGWRMRVALAAVLFAEPDLLVLDEPTNYLDLEGTLWLENYLAKYPHTALIVSHDRNLLNKAVDHIIHLEAGKLTLYKGTYDDFARERAEKLSLQLKMKKKQDDQRRHLQAFVDRFKAKASKARQAQSRVKRLEKMQEITIHVDERVPPFYLPSPKKELSPPIIQLEDAVVGYGETAILRNLNLRIDPDDRIALLGANGNGKSTFAKLLTGRLDVMAGRKKAHHRMEIAFLTQHQLDELNPNESAYDHVRALMPDATEAQVRAKTAAFGFDINKMETPAKNLSGGEKARLLFSVETFHGPHLLVLDEPTNHLDIEAREALVEALNEYEGAVIIISHDRHLLELSADRLWLVANGTVTPYGGDLDDYEAFLLKEARMAKSASGGEKADKADKGEKRKDAANTREKQAPQRKRLSQIETELEKLRLEIERLDEALAHPDLFVKDPAKGAQVAKAKAQREKTIEALEEEWLTLSEALEQA